MFDKRSRTTYYIANLGAGRVSVIDGQDVRIITEIETGERPINIIVDEENNIYISNDRNGEITIIKDLYGNIRKWRMPNNGNLQVDLSKQVIYLSNTQEVCTYSLITGEKLFKVSGYFAIDELILDRSKKRLFMLDVLDNIVYVYDSSDFHELCSFKGLENGATSLALSEDELKLYIGGRGGVSALTISNGKIDYIEMEADSKISEIQVLRNQLYIVDKGSQQIEIINPTNKEGAHSIRATLPLIQRAVIHRDGESLLVTSHGYGGEGALDIINLVEGKIQSTLLFGSNSRPSAIGIVCESGELVKVEDEVYPLVIPRDIDDGQSIGGEYVLGRRIVSIYKEKIDFPETTTIVLLKKQQRIYYKKIIFEQCQMIRSTMEENSIPGKEEYRRLKYSYYIPYHMKLMNDSGEEIIIDGSLGGVEEAILYFPDYIREYNPQFEVKSVTHITTTPKITGNRIKFGADMLISTMLCMEDLIIIPKGI